MNRITPFKLTPDDMADLDRKTARGLEPLLDALNVTLQQLVQTVNADPPVNTNSGTFNVGATGSAYVDIKAGIPTKPAFVTLGWFGRTDGTQIANVFSFTPVIIGDGSVVRLLFVGLDVDAQYSFTVRIE